MRILKKPAINKARKVKILIDILDMALRITLGDQGQHQTYGSKDVFNLTGFG